MACQKHFGQNPETKIVIPDLNGDSEVINQNSPVPPVTSQPRSIFSRVFSIAKKPENQQLAHKIYAGLYLKYLNNLNNHVIFNQSTIA